LSSPVHRERESLQRTRLDAINEAPEDELLKKFPPITNAKETALILKVLKTETSMRRIFLPATVARLLIEHKAVPERENYSCGGSISEAKLNTYTIPNQSHPQPEKIIFP